VRLEVLGGYARHEQPHASKKNHAHPNDQDDSYDIDEVRRCVHSG
jgi:hypothetical protein